MAPTSDTLPLPANETVPAPAHDATRAGRRRWSAVAAVLVLGVVLAAVAYLYFGFGFETPAPSYEGSVRIDSVPPGLEVTIDGIARGVTPVTITLAQGPHTAALRRGADIRELAISVAPRVETVHHVYWDGTADAPPVAPPQADGALEIITSSPGAQVSVDGVIRGRTPLLMTDVAGGTRAVTVRSGGVVTRRTIDVRAGSTTTLVISDVASTRSLGWLAVDVTTPLRVLENKKVIGTTESETIALAAGEHTLEFASERLGFQAYRVVKIDPEQTTRISVPLPSAPLSVNATPWAEVWIDGRRVGETPMGNLRLPIGVHHVEFRHPSLGSRRTEVTVSLTGAARIAVDMRKP